MNEIWIEKYRPSSLDEIVGQEDIVNTLKAFVRNGDIPHMIFAGPAGTGKTSAAIAVAVELFGDSWKDSYLELNSSNNRGIDTMRGHEERDRKWDKVASVKDYARIMPSNERGFKIIFMDEADMLTNEAQSALRRTMEVYSGTTRFIFSCNYSSQIIPPIQSRCVVFRFRQVTPEAMKTMIGKVMDAEKMELGESEIDAIIDVSEGDGRKVMNLLQAASMLGKVTASRIYDIAGTASSSEMKKLVSKALEHRLFEEAVAQAEEMMTAGGLSGIDIIKGIHSVLRRSQINPRIRIKALIAVGEAEFRLVEGSSDKIQVDALLARLVSIGSESV